MRFDLMAPFVDGSEQKHKKLQDIDYMPTIFNQNLSTGSGEEVES